MSMTVYTPITFLQKAEYCRQQLATRAVSTIDLDAP